MFSFIRDRDRYAKLPANYSYLERHFKEFKVIVNFVRPSYCLYTFSCILFFSSVAQVALELSLYDVCEFGKHLWRNQVEKGQHKL